MKNQEFHRMIIEEEIAKFNHCGLKRKQNEKLIRISSPKLIGILCIFPTTLMVEFVTGCLETGKK